MLTGTRVSSLQVFFFCYAGVGAHAIQIGRSDGRATTSWNACLESDCPATPEQCDAIETQIVPMIAGRRDAKGRWQAGFPSAFVRTAGSGAERFARFRPLA